MYYRQERIGGLNLILLEPGPGKGQDGIKMCGYVQGRARVEAGRYTQTAVVEF